MTSVRHFRVVITLCLQLLAAVCAFSCREAPRSVAGYTVVTSILPVNDMVKNIAGDYAESFYVIPPGANPHIFEPSPAKVAQIRKARLFIGVSPAFDGWIEKFLSPGTATHYLKLTGTHGHHHNPHIWLSLRNARFLCETIANLLTEHIPSGGKTFSANFMAYRDRLEELDKKNIARFQVISNKQFIQWHPAWNYFAEDYGLIISGTLQKGHGESLSVKGFRDIAEKAGKRSVRVITTELRVQSPEIDAMAREIGGFIVRLDTIGDPDIKGRSTYLELMEYNSAALAGALNKQ